MTREEELIGMLKILKEQARKSCKDTAVLDVKIDSFIFVIDEAIKELEQEPKWIPVSERLPQDGRYICDYGDCIDFGLITNGEWYVDGVIAWMPLPQPYKAESEE